jgi:hypothetical protein
VKLSFPFRTTVLHPNCLKFVLPKREVFHRLHDEGRGFTEEHQSLHDLNLKNHGLIIPPQKIDSEDFTEVVHLYGRASILPTGIVVLVFPCAQPSVSIKHSTLFPGLMSYLSSHTLANIRPSTLDNVYIPIIRHYF